MKRMTAMLLVAALALTGYAADNDGKEAPLGRFRDIFRGKKEKPSAAASIYQPIYNKLTGRLTAKLPGAVARTVRNVERAAKHAKVTIEHKTVDGITANIDGRLSDRRKFHVKLTGDGFDQTTITLRISPNGLPDAKVGGDESAARMLLQYIQKEAGIEKGQRKKKFLFF